MDVEAAKIIAEAMGLVADALNDLGRLLFWFLLAFFLFKNMGGQT